MQNHLPGERPIWTTGIFSIEQLGLTQLYLVYLMHRLIMLTGTSYDVVGNTEGATTYYQHETGTDQVKSSATTAIASNIESGDFDIAQGGADLRGDGEFIMKIRRFIPDFLSQTGNTQITLQLRDYSNNSQASSASWTLYNYFINN